MRVFQAIMRCETWAAWGRPVVPPVKIKAAMDSASTAGVVTALTELFRNVVSK